MAEPTFAHSPEFQRLVRGDDAADLARVALEIARDGCPEVDVEAYLARIDRLADRVRDRCRDGAAVRHLLGQINWVLFVEEGLQGNDSAYYDPRNSYLNEVLDRKLGIPISLSVLYLAVAERLGLVMHGVNLPGHFLIRTGQGGQTIFVDPYHGGLLLDRAGCARRVEEVTGQPVALDDASLAPCTSPVLVARMLRNLKAVYLRQGDFAAAVPVLRRLVALSPADPLERRDLGVACLHLERAGESIGHLQAYLDARPQADDADDVGALLRLARRKVAEWN